MSHNIPTTDEAVNIIISSSQAWRRRKYTLEEQRTIIKLYDGFKCKAAAMRAINSIEGFEHVYVRKIRRWKSQSKPMGRPVSPEFELEVMEEYLMAMQQITCLSTRQKSSHSYSKMKECAKKVFNNDYWDEDSFSYVKKWQLDKRTCNLQFTNKWVSGMLRRDKDRGNCCPADVTATDAQVVEEQAVQVNDSWCDELCGDGSSPTSSDLDALFHEVMDGIDDLAAAFDTGYYSLFDHNTAGEEFSLIDWDTLFE